MGFSLIMINILTKQFDFEITEKEIILHIHSVISYHTIKARCAVIFEEKKTKFIYFSGNLKPYFLHRKYKKKLIKSVLSLNCQ